MIHKGCTCTDTFNFPYPRSEVATLFITYSEEEEVIVEKTVDDCDFLEGKISVKLSQEETLRFGDNACVETQIRGRLIDNTAIKSKIVKVYTDRVLKKDVI